MKGDQIKYSEGYKYQLRQTYAIQTDLRPKKRIKTEWLDLDEGGFLWIKRGYAWDGPSGPTFDTKNSLRGSLVHDAIYQFIRLGLLDGDCKDYADNLFLKILEEDGMADIRASLWYEGVHLFAGFATRGSAEPAILTAP